MLSKLKRFQKDNEQGSLCMEKCFEDMKSQGVRERENILYLTGALLATVLSLKHSNVESKCRAIVKVKARVLNMLQLGPRTVEYLVELTNQLGNLKEMMALTRLFYDRADDVEPPLFAAPRNNPHVDDEEEYSELNWLDAPSSHLVQVIKNSANMSCDPFKIPSEPRLALIIPIFGLLIVSARSVIDDTRSHIGSRTCCTKIPLRLTSTARQRTKYDKYYSTSLAS